MINKIKSIDKKALAIIMSVLGVIIIAAIIFIIISHNSASLSTHTSNDNVSPNSDSSSDTGTYNEASSSDTESTTQDTEPFTTVTYDEDKEDPAANTQDINAESGAAVDVNHMEAAKTSIGIDVSRYQGTINWQEAAQSGISYAMIRVGYRTMISGEICEDPYARYNITNALANGIDVGVYFFSSAISKAEAIEEAEFVIDFIADYNITYPVAYNCEGFNDSENRQYSLSKDSRSLIACEFLNKISQAGYIPMFYASKSELENNSQWNTTDISKLCKIWVAWYPSSPYPDTASPDYSGAYHMWQYTNNGSVSGIDGTVDINVSYLNISSDNTPDSTPVSTETITVSPEANMTFTQVNETVTAKIEVNLRNIPSQDSDSTVTALLKNGDTATRTGISDSGWSRLIYNGQVCYAVSSYLTTDLSYTTETAAPSSDAEETDTANEQETTMRNVFTETNDKVTPKEEVNLRTLPSITDSQIAATIKNGDVVTRTGISDLGWARVIYNGQTLYCINSYLEAVE